MDKVIPFVLGGAALGAFFGIAKVNLEPKPINYNRLLKFEPHYFTVDPHCAETFVKLQNYRECSEVDFDNAGDDTDSLFCIIDAISNGDIKWSKERAKEANGYYLRATNSLEEFKNKARHWLYDVPLKNYKELPDDQATDENLSMLEQRTESGQSNFIDVSKCVDDIKAILHNHILRLSSIQQE